MKVTPSKAKSKVTFSTKTENKTLQMYKWWTAKTDKELADQVVSSANFLRENQQYRQREAARYARLYGNMSMFSFAGNTTAKMDTNNNTPVDRPTFNVVQSAADTLISRISQNRPQPVFLTDNSDYKERNLAKKLNNFVGGEFYQTKAYDKATTILRDALVEGTGCLKVYETQDKKVGLDRVILTELFTDPNESIYGDPRNLFQVKLVDRGVLLAQCPGYKAEVMRAEQAFATDASGATQTISDLVIVVEAWHLPSGKDAGDGRHTLACGGGVLFDEEYTKDRFPFVFLHYSSRMLGFWAQGLAEQLMNTQMEINSLLYTISKSIKLVGVPRVFVEDGSKVVKAHLNNEIGTIVTYRGTKPSYEVANCVPQELYAQLQRLIDYAYQQCGVSALQASSTKPAGLNSGEAIRSYNDISTDRFASLAKKYDNLFVDLAYLITDQAKDIAERDGEYQTVYPGKDGTQKVDLPEAELLKDPFVIQCFDMSSLPRDPAGRLQKVTEMIQSQMISLKEGRRLLDFPDLQQVEKLANAAEERIYQVLDEIIESGTYTPPDPFTDLEQANEIVVQYINLHSTTKLEEEKLQLLRDWFTQVQALKQAAMPQPAPGMPGQAPGSAPAGGPAQAVPQPLPQSELLPQSPTS